jgi:hypothetical protein
MILSAALPAGWFDLTNKNTYFINVVANPAAMIPRPHAVAQVIDGIIGNGLSTNPLPVKVNNIARTPH